MADFEAIYETLTGNRKPSQAVDWVKDLSGSETEYEKAHQQLWNARLSLTGRFGLSLEDPDLERIMDAVSVIEKEIGYHMFCLGVEYTQRGRA